MTLQTSSCLTAAPCTPYVLQNDFCLPGSVLCVGDAMVCLPKVVEAVDLARSKGVPVIWVIREHDAEGTDVELFRQPMFKAGKASTVPGTKGALGCLRVLSQQFRPIYGGTLEPAAFSDCRTLHARPHSTTTKCGFSLLPSRRGAGGAAGGSCGGAGAGEEAVQRLFCHRAGHGPAVRRGILLPPHAVGAADEHVCTQHACVMQVASLLTYLAFIIMHPAPFPPPYPSCRRMGVQHVVIVGVQTPNCIRGTAWDALALDYPRVTVLADATASRSEAVQAANLEDMRCASVHTPTVAEWAAQL